MELHCVATKETDEIGLCAFYCGVASCVNLVNYLKSLNPRTFTVFETKKKAEEVAREWNKDFVNNGLQKRL